MKTNASLPLAQSAARPQATVKRPSLFVALLKHEVGLRPLNFDRLIFYLAGFLYWGWLNFMALIVVSRQAGHEGAVWQTPAMSGIWLLVMAVFSLLGPMVLPLLAAHFFKASEFQFTRAISRRLQFRAHATIITFVVLAPTIVNLVWAFISPDLLADARAIDQGRFLAGFPGSFLQPGDPSNLLAPGGRIAAAAFQFWLAAMALMLTTVLYYARISDAAKHGRIPLEIPVLAAGVFAVAGYFQFHSSVNLYYTWLALFRSQWIWLLAVLAPAGVLAYQFCERRFCRLEIR